MRFTPSQNAASPMGLSQAGVSVHWLSRGPPVNASASMRFRPAARTASTVGASSTGSVVAPVRPEFCHDAVNPRNDFVDAPRSAVRLAHELQSGGVQLPFNHRKIILAVKVTYGLLKIFSKLFGIGVASDSSFGDYRKKRREVIAAAQRKIPRAFSASSPECRLRSYRSENNRIRCRRGRPDTAWPRL